MDVGALQVWLRSPRNYQQGLELLKASGQADANDIFLLDLGETSVSRKHLVRAIESLVNAAVKETASVRTVKRPLITKADIVREQKEILRDPLTDGYDDERLPPELKQLRAEIKDMLKEMSYLRDRLELLPSDADRYRSAVRIIDLDKHITSAYARLDTWRATGVDPGTVKREPDAQDLVNLTKELRNLVSYIARHKTGSRPAPPEKVDVWLRRKAEIEAFIDALP